MKKNNELTIQKEISPVVRNVEAMNIESQGDMTTATTVLSQLNHFLDGLVEEREKITKPINEALKEVRGRYKPTEMILEEAIKNLKSKMSVYQTEQLRITREKEQKIADSVAKGNIKVETGIKKLEAIDAPEENIKTAEGTVGFRTVKKFKIIDVDKVPDEYFTLDEKAIKKAMEAGIDVPGVEYYEEQSIINRRN